MFGVGVRILIALLLAAAAGACGGKSQHGGSAGGPAPGKVGDPCQVATCDSGYLCEHSGIFAGQCTVGCTSDLGCTFLDSRGRCFGNTNAECGLPCYIDTQCPTGTHCAGLSPQAPTPKVCQTGH